MRGMVIVRVLLFFSFDLNGVYYPCALVEWFDRVQCDATTGMWIVWPALIHGRHDKSVIPLDSFLRAAHLIPVFSDKKLPQAIDYTQSLDKFSAYFVNKYIDHHAYKIAF
jgi:hypothetical protein